MVLLSLWHCRQLPWCCRLPERSLPGPRCSGVTGLGDTWCGACPSGGFGGAGRCVVEIRGEDECSGGERFSPLGVLLCGVPPGGWTLLKCVLGGVLLSRTLAGAVPSALSGLASGFGMDTGRFPVAVTTETTRWAVRDDRHLWCGYSVIRVAACRPALTRARAWCVCWWLGWVWTV